MPVGCMKNAHARVLKRNLTLYEIEESLLRHVLRQGTFPPCFFSFFQVSVLGFSVEHSTETVAETCNNSVDPTE